MNFQSIRIRNFLTIGDSGDIFLENRGLNLLQGENNDDPSASSNGSGKSTLPDAICWLLYDVTARGESGDAVVNNKSKKDCSVVGTFMDGSLSFTVARYRKHKEFKNELHLRAHDAGGTSIVLTKGTVKETQAELERIIGCSYPVFKAAVYAGQEDMPDLPRMTDKQLKSLIEEAAGIERLEQAYVIANRNVQVLMGHMSQLASVALQTKNGIHESQVALETNKLRHAEHEAQREEAAKKHEANAELAVTAARETIATVRTMDEPALIVESEKLKIELASVGAVSKVATDYQSTMTPVDRQRAVKAAEAARLEREALAIHQQYKNAETELAKPCGECGKPHTADELETLKGHIKSRLAAKIAEKVAVSAEVDKLDTQLAAMRTELVRLQSAIPDSTQLLNRQHEIQNKILGITRLKAKAQADIQSAQNLRTVAGTVRTNPNPHQSAIDMSLGRIATLTASHDAMKGKILQTSADLEVAKSVAQVFGPAGVRAHILDTVTPFLNDRTADYLGTLSDGNISAVWSTLSRTAKGELREKFSIDVEHAKGGSSFGLCSGGEKRKVRLATMLALQDLVASRATKPIELFMADEIDEALDEPGLERLMCVLESKAREKGTLIMISHNSLKDWCDAVTTVTKMDGLSTVQGSLCDK